MVKKKCLNLMFSAISISYLKKYIILSIMQICSCIKISKSKLNFPSMMLYNCSAKVYTCSLNKENLKFKKFERVRNILRNLGRVSNYKICSLYIPINLNVMKPQIVCGLIPQVRFLPAFFGKLIFNP